MSEQLSPGIYKAGFRSYEGAESLSPSRIAFSMTVVIARGDSINENSSGFLGGVFGVESSKWYIVKTYAILAKERAKDGGFLTTGSRQEEIGDMIERKFETKKDAESYVDRRISVDERL